MKIKRTLTVLLAVLLLLGTLAGCSAVSESVNGAAGFDSMAPDKGLAESSGSAEAPGAPEAEPSGLENRKLIRTLNINAETEDLDTLLAKIDSQVAQLGGYMESREVRNGSAYASSRSRYANLVIRIPVDRLDEFVTHVSGASNVTSSTEEARDVTLSYVATESRIIALETEQTRLLELLSKAETMDELLLIESYLTDVRTELEEVTSQLRLYDNLVDYGTVYLYLNEVQKLTATEEPGLWQRITDGFSESMTNLGAALTNLLVFTVTRLPYLIPVAVIALVVLLIVKLATRKKKARPMPPAPQAPNQESNT